MSTEGTSKGHGGPQTEENSPAVITSVSKMSTECSSGDQNAAHFAQKSAENNDLDHAKIGATQRSTL
eukprot:11221387-Lingulodinium_polyedra.AAC.1